MAPSFSVEEEQVAQPPGLPPVPLTGGLKGRARQRLVVELYSRGYCTVPELAERFGVSQQRLWNVLGREDSKILRSEIEQQLEQDFKTLFGKAVDVIRNGLEHPDPKIRMAAVALYFKYTRPTQMNVRTEQTAEDVVKTLMDEYQRRFRPCPTPEPKLKEVTHVVGVDSES